MRDITVAGLIFKSARWLDFMLRELAAAKNDVRMYVLIVGNDPNTEVANAIRNGALDKYHDSFAGLRYHEHRNENPYSYAMGRVYHAWNAAVRNAPTEDVVLVNSDMAYFPHWLDELVWLKDSEPCIPTSLLVESGRVPSGLPQFVQNFGRTPEDFDRASWLVRAAELHASEQRVMQRGLYMPVLLRKTEFEKLGGYAIQVRNHTLASDAAFFNRCESELGLRHLTAKRSIVYHCQLGESEDDVA